MLGKYLWRCAVCCFMGILWKGESILGWEEAELSWGQQLTKETKEPPEESGERAGRP